MLASLTVPTSLLTVLEIFRGCFTTPSFATFVGALITGTVAQTGRRTVCGMRVGAGLSREWSHDRVHYFFARARWDLDQVGLTVTRLIVAHLVPERAPILVSVDDTLFKRYGRKIFGAAWQYDGAAKGPKPVGRGTCFVVVTITVRLPFHLRPAGLPVLARLHRPGQEATKVDIASQLVRLLATAFPGRRIEVVGDGAYHGKPLRGLPRGVTWTCRIPKSAVLFEPAPPRTGRRGRPRLKGDRLGTVKQLTEHLVFTTDQVRRYGRVDAVQTAEITCLWYGSFHVQTVHVIWIRGQGETSGFDLALVTTDLQASAAELVERYAARWPIEVTFEQARQHLGVGQAENRTRRAVERTVPFGLFVYSLTVLWYALHGHHPADIAERCIQAPWYSSKTEPSFADMILKLRRTIIAARYIPTRAGQPTDHEITAVQLAWAAAAA